MTSQKICRIHADSELKPTVSIIVPFYNAEKTLQRCLSGILGQTYTALELILIDDGSSDSGADICRYYVNKDSRVQLVSKNNSGVSASRNVGLARAAGEWVYFADADDWLAPWAIEALVDAASLDAKVDLVVSDFYRVCGSLISHKHGPAAGMLSQERYAQHMSDRPANFYFASLWNKLFKREFIERESLYFDTSSSFGEDHIFILDYLRMVRKVMLVDSPLYYYVDNAGSLMHQGLNPAAVVRMKLRIFKPYVDLFNALGMNSTARERSKVLSFLFWPATDGLVRSNSEQLDVSCIPG